MLIMKIYLHFKKGQLIVLCVFFLFSFFSCKKELTDENRNVSSNTLILNNTRILNNTGQPIIILKADDLGNSTPNWDRFISIVSNNNICASIGVIPANITSSDSKSEIKRLSSLTQLGNNYPIIEFWSHGYSHLEYNTESFETSQSVPTDYDGDGKADLSIYTSDGKWLIDYSKNGFDVWDVTYVGYGNSTNCHPVPADYDGDGKADLSIKTDDQYWYIDYANNGFGKWDVCYSGYGGAIAHPVPADYDGDGKADLSIKTDDQYWYIDYARNGFGRWEVCYSGYGGSTAHPVPADYDGDGKADLSIKTDDQYWYIDYAKNGFGHWEVCYSGYGGTNAHPVPADYDGDGKADLSVFVEDCRWLIDNSSNGFGKWNTPPFYYSSIEGSTSKPVPADYNGDGKAECSVTTKHKEWLIDYSHAGSWDNMALYPKAEFFGRPYDFQYDHIQLTQNYFLDSLGITNHTFGAPFNATDANTNSSLKQFNAINVWLCYQNYEKQYDSYWKDPKKDLISISDYHIILDVDYNYLPDFSAQPIIDNYETDKNKPYILIQIHPAGWDDNSFNEFVRLINFYSGKGIFMTPYQYFQYL
jgi:hypothetical protein